MKNFQTLSKKECKEVSAECFLHADSKYKDAVLLANAKSYGNGISNLILCLEETMKGLILSLDADGFQFRNKVKGINGIFENHKLRYFLGLVMSCFHIFSEDLNGLVIKARTNPKAFTQEVKYVMANPNLMENYFIETMNKLQLEIDWFSKLNERRMSGMYVAYEDGVKTPISITENEFNLFIQKIDSVRNVSNFISKAFNSDVNEFLSDVEDLQNDFKEGKYYAHLGGLIKAINDKKTDSFDDLYSRLEDLKNDIVDGVSKRLLD